MLFCVDICVSCYAVINILVSISTKHFLYAINNVSESNKSSIFVNNDTTKCWIIEYPSDYYTACIEFDCFFSSDAVVVSLRAFFYGVLRWKNVISEVNFFMGYMCSSRSILSIKIMLTRHNPWKQMPLLLVQCWINFNSREKKHKERSVEEKIELSQKNCM